jgi:hypothetical protein
MHTCHFRSRIDRERALVRLCADRRCTFEFLERVELTLRQHGAAGALHTIICFGVLYTEAHGPELGPEAEGEVYV